MTGCEFWIKRRNGGFHGQVAFNHFFDYTSSISKRKKKSLIWKFQNLDFNCMLLVGHALDNMLLMIREGLWSFLPDLIGLSQFQNPPALSGRILFYPEYMWELFDKGNSLLFPIQNNFDELTQVKITSLYYMRPMNPWQKFLFLILNEISKKKLYGNNYLFVEIYYPEPDLHWPKTIY